MGQSQSRLAQFVFGSIPGDDGPKGLLQRVGPPPVVAEALQLTTRRCLVGQVAGALERGGSRMSSRQLHLECEHSPSAASASAPDRGWVPVDLTLSKRGDYVVRSAIALARAYDGAGWRKIREVVEETDVPQTFAPQILTTLVRAGLADSRSGRDGGYRLTRSSEVISLLEVVEAAEGPLRPEHCALGDGPCRWDAVCPLHETWRSASDALREALATTTLATLAARDQALGVSSLPRVPDSHRPTRRASRCPIGSSWMAIPRFSSPG